MFFWKSIVINILLAAILTLKMAAFTPSITTLDYFLGIGLFAFFCANFNTENQAYDYAKECKSEVVKFADIFELPACQKIVIPAYLYALAAVCVALAVIELVIVTFFNLCKAWADCCCRKERPADRQVLRMEAERQLYEQIYERLESENE